MIDIEIETANRIQMWQQGIELSRNLFFCKVWVGNLGDRPTKVLIWDSMPFEMLQRWKWYFEYRAALLKVQYPRIRVEVTTGLSEKKKDMATVYKNRITSAKSQLTKSKNKLAAFEAAFVPTLFVREAKKLQQYQHAEARIRAAEEALANLEDLLAEHLKSQNTLSNENNT
jgi:hypothetical protein